MRLLHCCNLFSDVALIMNMSPPCAINPIHYVFVVGYFANICQTLKKAVLYSAGYNLSAERTHTHTDTHHEHVGARLIQTGRHVDVSLSSCLCGFEVVVKCSCVVKRSSQLFY